ncbi:host cell factor 2 [Megalops cyprinoides]|uniref:host cell factor 2 n=1 Tax=Megalops cyprinoides TaxID=118141 RepID=UPI001864F3C0|nr:host cell factor 2 [Megalops cyprinoides]
MSRRNGPCLWTPIPPSGPAPCDRYKHSCCAHSDSIYLLGGRGKNLLNDFWKYNVVRNEWVELDCSCDEAPEEVEEHTMVTYQGLLYVFGGMIDSGYSGRKTPLWLYDTDKERWLNWEGRNINSQSTAPVNRKGHSAVVFEPAMYIYGGYIDMKGSSQEFWRFDFDTRAWSMLAPVQGEASPGPRHGHSAMTYQDCMYLFGGLMGLREQSDFWRWSFSSCSWSSIKSLSGPSKLVGHSAVGYRDNMLVFGGGGTQSSPRNSLWRFSFAAQGWERLATLTGNSPPCKIHHCSTGLGPSYQPQASTHGPLGEGHLDRHRHTGAKLRPFKNKCFPSEGGIELETFCVENKHNSSEHSGSCNGQAGSKARGKQPALRGTCLTFENQEAFSKGWNCDSDSGTEESMALHLPDLLLVLGGRPMGGHPGISVWQLTLTDL